MVVFGEDVQAKIRANNRNWDARAPIHVRSRFYGIGDRDRMSWFAPFEWRDLGRLDGREVVHLQCHLGVETMGFALEGASAPESPLPCGRAEARETVPDSPINLVPQSRAGGWSCALAAAGEAAERVRVGAGWVRVGAGWCCCHCTGAENDNRADNHFRDEHYDAPYSMQLALGAYLTCISDSRVTPATPVLRQVGGDLLQCGEVVVDSC
jgi:hypothetical protein